MTIVNGKGMVMYLCLKMIRVSWSYGLQRITRGEYLVRTYQRW